MDARQSLLSSKTDFYQRVSIFLGFLTLLLGAAVIVGWYTHTQALIQVSPAFVPMQYNTALGFFLSGLGFLMLRYPRAAACLAVIVFLVGVLTLLEYIFGINIGIDQLFMHHYVTVKTSHPGRMAPNTALCFLLSSLVLLILSFPRQVKHYQLLTLLLGVLIIILGVIALSGYLVSLPTAYGWGNLTRMAVHTSAGFIFIGFSFLFYIFSKNFFFKKRISLMQPLLIMLISVTAVLFIWQMMLATAHNDLTKSIKQAKNQIISNVVTSLNSHTTDLEQISDYWESRGEKIGKAQLVSASSYFKSWRLTDVGWIDANNHLTWLHSAREDIHDSDFNRRVIEYFKTSPETQAIKLAAPLKIRHGLYVLPIYRSVYYKGKFQGKIIGGLYIKPWLDSLFPGYIKNNWVIHFGYQGEIIYRLGKDVAYFIREHWGIQQNFNAQGIQWQLKVWPTRHAYDAFYSWTPTFIFIFGLLLAVILALLSYLWSSFKRAKEDAECANKEKSQFLSSMSHELRTPLNAAVGYAQLLEYDQTLPKEKREYARMIRSATKHLLSLINDVLDLSKIEAGKVELSIESVALNDVVAECISLSKPLLEKYDVSLFYDVHKNGNVYIEADYFRLKQIMLNFLSNAMKYNRPKGNVTILVDSVSDENVRIGIKDTGMGIAKDLQAKLFLPFQRLGAERSNIEGTGIGLVITKNLVEMLHGSVEIDSQEGIGTTIWLTLPCGDADESKRRSMLEPGEDVISDRGIAMTKKILLVEDNPANQAVVAQQLQYFKCRVDIASDGEEGYVRWKSGDYGLILMDCNMPKMDGYQLTKLIRKEEAGKNIHIPIIAFTANAYKEELSQCYDSGMDDFLIKPVELGVLKETLIRWLPADSVKKDILEKEVLKDETEEKQDPDLLINMSVLRKYVGDDKEIQKKMLDKFFESAADIVKDLKAASDNNNMSDVQFHAHKLKSSAKAVGAVRLSDACLELENSAKEKDQEKASALVIKVLDLLEMSKKT